MTARGEICSSIRSHCRRTWSSWCPERDRRTKRSSSRSCSKRYRNFRKTCKSQAAPAFPAPAQAIMAGQQKYTDIRVPVLAIYAVPHDRGASAQNDPAARAAAEAADAARTEAQAKAFEKGVPSARVVRIAHANHFVFVSNEADVLREMNAF